MTVGRGAGVAGAHSYPKERITSAPLNPLTMGNPPTLALPSPRGERIRQGVGFAIRSPQARQPNTARGSTLHPLKPDHTPALEGRCLLQRNGSTQQQAGW